MIPWFRFSRAPWGTVYLLQSRQSVGLYKVGFTRRKTTTRRAELNRGSGEDMAVVATVSMPWALKCEALVLRRLRRNPFRRRDHRGTEWFWLGSSENITHIIKRIESAAVYVEFVAKCKLSWPKGVQKKKFLAQAKQLGGAHS